MFLMGVTLISALTLTLTVLIIGVHHRDPDKPLPPWVDKCILHCLGRALGCRTKAGQKPKQTTTANNDSGKEWSETVGSDNSRFIREDSSATCVTSPGNWIQVAKVLDRLSFVFVLLLAIALTVGTLGACLVATPTRSTPLAGYGYLYEKHKE